jgi:hypothetical protein
MKAHSLDNAHIQNGLNAFMDDNPKMRKAYETTAQRLTRQIAKLRKEGLSDIEIGVIVGSHVNTQPELVFTILILREFGETA